MTSGGGTLGIGVAELERAIRAADPAALLVAPRILRRVIKHDRGLNAIGLMVPHRKSFVIGAVEAAGIVEPDELGLEPRAEVPPTLILLARPDASTLAKIGRGEALIRYWRLLFHARVHMALEGKSGPRDAGRDRPLTPVEVRDRIDRIGQAEFDEVRAVLRHENYLLPPADDRSVLVEFAAVYLELRRFAAHLVPHYFPAIEDFGAIDRLLAEDLDSGALFAATRPAGAPSPGTAEVLEVQTSPRPGREEPSSIVGRTPGPEFDRLSTWADAAASRGNHVRAAILRARAVRYATVRRSGHARGLARAELDRLARRLAAALDLDDEARHAWQRTLPALLVRSKPGIRSPEARLLYDLQKVCVDHEREVYAVDLFEWIFSLGRRPIRRRLPNQREVLMSKHLRGASRRLASTRLAGDDRARLGTLLGEAVEAAEARLRGRFRPLITRALARNGMGPRNVPERVAFGKLVEELLDQVVGRGFLSLGDVRDALSRSQLKLPDLAGPLEFLRGDRLLRIDSQLADSLDGVYRRGEIYLRWLQRLSSAAFGTRVGRFLTRYAALPYGGAFVILSGLQHLIEPIARLTAGVEHVHLHGVAPVTAVGTLLMGLFHAPRFRAAVVAGLRSLAIGVRAVLVDAPRWILNRETVRRVLESRAFSILARRLLVPLAISMAAWALVPDRIARRTQALSGAALVFGASSLAIGSRAWRDAEEILTDELVRNWQRFRIDLLPGLFRLVMDSFSWLLESLDRMIYAVDEWLRFRGGETRASLVLKAVLGAFWAVLTYLVRIYVVVLIEPQVNPIKHFPVVTVSHKVMLPFSPIIYRLITAPLFPVLGKVAARTIAATNVLLLPGAFGFLVWELKENWRLYEANRPRALKPVVVGEHGETLARLLRPGFHSGTLPKLFAKLRKAGGGGLRRPGRGRSTLKHLRAIQHVEEEIGHLVDRELVSLLHSSRSMGPCRVAAGRIDVGSNLIRVALPAPGSEGGPLRLTFEEQSGWLVAGIEAPGWLDGLDPDRRDAMATALAGFYKLAGVDLVREQIVAGFAPEAPSYDVGDAGLIVWPLAGIAGGRVVAAEREVETDSELAAVYDLRDGPLLHPRTIDGAPESLGLPTLDAERLVFARVAILWTDWVAAWERDQAGARGPGPPADVIGPPTDGRRPGGPIAIG